MHCRVYPVPVLFTCWLAMAISGIAGFSSSRCQAQSRLEKVLTDQLNITEEGYWLYNDLDAGREAARKSGKPMIVTFRCIPCEHCVKLDEELIEADPEIQRLLSQYVRVRQVSNNGLDLKTFQFDYDQSFNVMLMNEDGTIYGRYGTRSDQTDWESDVSVRGLARALRKGLELHRNYPDNQSKLAGKQGDDPLFATPNDAPLHKGRFPTDLKFNDQVVKNCIHCHMIGDAQRDYFVRDGKPIPDKYLFQYPHPKALGLIIDPATCGTITQVKEDSPAKQAGFQSGDEIVAMNEQPVLSIADMQWVFQQADDGDTIQFTIQRDQETHSLEMTLPDRWRERDDIAWRVSSWPLRRMVFGGMVLKPVDPARRSNLKIPDGKLALEVTHVGQYGLHATAKKAGIRKGDVVVGYGGRDDLRRETDLLAYGTRNFQSGDTIPIEILRGGERQTVEIPAQQ